MELIAILEGLLFVAGDEGLTKDKLIDIMNITSEEFDETLNKLTDEYSKSNRGINIEFLGNHLKLVTKKEHKEYYEKLIEIENDSVLSQACLETLAIIAYNEPITRVQIDEIRGIGSSHIVRKLLMKNLIKDLGKSDAPGRPILYGITDQFLDYFGLSSLSDLPPLDEVEIDDEEKDLFESRYREE